MVSERSFHLRMTGAAIPNVISKTGKIKQSNDQKWSAAAISSISFHGRGSDKSKPLTPIRFETTLINFILAAVQARCDQHLGRSIHVFGSTLIA